MRQAYGFIETVGLAAAIEASDIALKAANVELIGLELTRGFGYTTVKLQGSVSSVNAGIDSAKGSNKLIGKIVSTDIIPRPSDDIDLIVLSGDNLKMDQIGDKEVILEDVNEDIEEENEEIQGDIEEDVLDNINEDIREDSIGSEDKEEVEENTSEEDYTCNLCQDPECERHKGEPRDTCIHYENN